MARPATGQVIPRTNAAGVTTYALRFPAYGKREFITLGSGTDGWTAEKAADELAYVMAQVARGVWQPAQSAPKLNAPATDPTFHVFASEWFAAKRLTVQPKTAAHYLYHLKHNLLPFFGPMHLSQIDVQTVDQYTGMMLKQGRLNPRTINQSLARLAGILELAVEYGHMSGNPAKGSRRRVQAARAKVVILDQAWHVVALLEAAASLDRGERGPRDEPAWTAQARQLRDTDEGPSLRSIAKQLGVPYSTMKRRMNPEASARYTAQATAKKRAANATPDGDRRAILATYLFAGLRLNELLALRWRDVDLAAGRVKVVDSKTEAGVRTIDVLPTLRDVLLTHKLAARNTSSDALVFPSPRDPSKMRSETNVRTNVLQASMKRADALLEARALPLLPGGVTVHSLRHFYCSMLFARREEPPYVMAQIGHTDPKFTLRVYAHVAFRDPEDRERLCALVEGTLALPIVENAHGLAASTL